MKLITVFILKIRQRLSAKESRQAGFATLMINLVVITPLCGWLFQCGCDWPWAGLDSHCNYYQLDAEYQCPWCTSMLTGVLSSGLAISIGVFVVTSPCSYLRVLPVKCVLGLLIFVGVAVLLAGVAAWSQAYPLGIGRFLLR